MSLAGAPRSRRRLAIAFLLVLLLLGFVIGVGLAATSLVPTRWHSFVEPMALGLMLVGFGLFVAGIVRGRRRR